MLSLIENKKIENKIVTTRDEEITNSLVILFECFMTIDIVSPLNTWVKIMVHVKMLNPLKKSEELLLLKLFEFRSKWFSKMCAIKLKRHPYKYK